MDRHVILFLRSSLAWLALGVSLGLTMAVVPSLAVYRPAHFHMLFLGFVTMMIAGVGYHVIPRFAATKLHRPGLARLHFVLANVGLAVLVAGFVVRLHDRTPGVLLLSAGGVLSAAGAYLLAFNLWRTLDHAAVRPATLPPIHPRPFVVVDPGLRSTGAS